MRCCILRPWRASAKHYSLVGQGMNNSGTSPLFVDIRAAHDTGCSNKNLASKMSDTSNGVDGTHKTSKVPSVIFFGGDIVSLVALKALHNRLRSIMNSALPRGEGESVTHGEVRPPPLVVVCPYLPAAPQQIFKQHKRHYPIARYCVQHSIPLIPVDNPKSFAKSKALQQLLGAQGAPECESCDTEGRGQVPCPPIEEFDVAVVVSFRYFLPDKILQRLRYTINLHPSLLPRYRGASPMFAPLLRGDDEGGISIIKLPPKGKFMDGGDILLQRVVPIPREMTIREYFPLVTELGAQSLCECLFGAPPCTPTNTHTTTVETGDSNLLHSAYCDWPRTFNTLWNAARKQDYDVHFTKDPWHAPLLAKNSAIIRWNDVTAEEAYGTWRAFVGGEYFSPVTNATLDKNMAPVGAQLLKRLVTRALRQSQGQAKGECVAGQKNKTIDGGELQHQEPTEMDGVRSATNTRKTGHHETYPICREQLFVRCTFTEAIHPKSASTAVQEELEQLERRGKCCPAPGGTSSESAAGGFKTPLGTPSIQPGSAYFLTSEDLCAVKCRFGWFLWKAVVLEGSRAQPAGLLRKGMAMKKGRVYPRLFWWEANNNESTIGTTTIAECGVSNIV
uniref:Uncharacterized protein TCIL3000_11_15550 n=1 Tax=Trypanosoma congolense (strain IL3000) TaxID=1068625 RepID=G0V322_TRYCI|nr:unnamed protein product [Trypanosoma congolense IL3000]